MKECIINVITTNRIVISENVPKFTQTQNKYGYIPYIFNVPAYKASAHGQIVDDVVLHSYKMGRRPSTDPPNTVVDKQPPSRHLM